MTQNERENLVDGIFCGFMIFLLMSLLVGVPIAILLNSGV